MRSSVRSTTFPPDEARSGDGAGRTCSTRAMHRTAGIGVLTIALAAAGAACERKQPQPPQSGSAAPSSTTVAAEGQTAATPAEIYLQGQVDAGPIKLGYLAHLTRGDDGYAGTMDIPTQAARNVPLTGISVSGESWAFALPNGAKWTVAVDDGKPVACGFTQNGIEMTCTATLIDAEAFAAATKLERPQTPKPPFPYQAEDVTYENAKGGIELAATLTIPEGEGPFPAVVLVSGSGSQDRDETIMGHKPFWVIADYFSRRGIAVLRYDDRGVGGSTGDPTTSTIADHVYDAMAGFDYLRTRAEIDKKRIGIVGHSEGGSIAPEIAAKRRKDVGFIVMMAGMGIPGDQVLRGQVDRLLEQKGMPKEAREAELKRRDEIVAAINAHEDAEKRKAAVEALYEARGALNDATKLERQTFLTPYFVHFLGYDPRRALRKVKCPVLALNGELDIQVLPDANLPAIEKALKKNRAARVERLPGLNHLFQPAKTGSVDEYETIPITVDEGVLKLMAEWILEQ